MSTRPGDLDPGIVGFLLSQTTMTAEDFNHMILFESGLLGVSESSSDMETLLQQSTDNPKAADAINLFCYQLRKAIGSLATVLGGIDSLVFAGGMGERAPVIRAAICDGLDYLGINLDLQRNEAGDFLISSDHSRVGVHVMHTNEAAVIAAQTKEVIAHNTEVGEIHG
jgi:acetate kinase